MIGYVQHTTHVMINCGLCLTGGEVVCTLACGGDTLSSTLCLLLCELNLFSPQTGLKPSVLEFWTVHMRRTLTFVKSSASTSTLHFGYML